MIEILTIGGYSKVGRNCTAVKYKDDVVILDMGLHLDKYIEMTQDSEIETKISADALIKSGAGPDITVLKDWKDKVKAIVPSHGHLDHVGAVPFLLEKFPKVPVLCTAFTKEILNQMLIDEDIKSNNKIIGINSNSTYKLTENISIEFVHVTHSIPHAAIVIVHTPEGGVAYTNDFKFDNDPVIGQRPNYARLKELGKKKMIKAAIIDSLYSGYERKTPSENIAREMLKDVMLNLDTKGKIMIVTTFSSHIARLKSIIEFGKKLNRKVVFLGRSLHKYASAAEKVGLVHFSKEVDIVKFSSKIKKKLSKMSYLEDHLFVVTGHQGEPGSVLSKLIKKELPFDLRKGDIVIFSCNVIPTEQNIENRKKMEEHLRDKSVRIFKDIHVSGHGSREDQRDLIEMMQPENIIPAHCDTKIAQNMAELSKQLGYKKKNILISEDGNRLVIE